MTGVLHRSPTSPGKKKLLEHLMSLRVVLTVKAVRMQLESGNILLADFVGLVALSYVALQSVMFLLLLITFPSS